MSKFKEKFGINLNTIYCPQCNSEQPKIRTPKGWHDILWGGNTCKECGCKMDKYGKKRE